MRIDVDTLYENTNPTWDFYVLRECPDPAKIMGCSNGFVLNAVGNATWGFSGGFTPFADHLTVWNLGGLLFTDMIGGPGSTSGWFLTGGAAMPPAGGMPVYTTEKFWFSLDMAIGDLPAASTGDGIEIDSQFVGAAGAWKWSGLTCGQGGDPDRPLFLDKYGGDKGAHPHFLPVLELVCTGPFITGVPAGNNITVDICGTAQFTFGADPGMDGLDPATLTGWGMVSGIGNINNNGEYSAFVDPWACASMMSALRRTTTAETLPIRTASQ
jgi:hypothetical protein